MHATSEATPLTVDRRTELSPEAFRAQYYRAGKPVILSDATRPWRALRELTPAYLRAHFPDATVELGEEPRRLADALDAIEASDAAHPAPYPCRVHVPSALPDLLPLLEPLPLPQALPNRLTNPWMLGQRFGSKTELFLGGPGGDFPYAHYDYYHLDAWINMIHGRKEFTVFLPASADAMYPLPDNPWKSAVNVFRPDLSCFPRFADVPRCTFVLEPGETLYIPHGTWHTARSLTVSLSIAFDQLTSRNMAGYLHDIAWFRRQQRQRAWKTTMLLTWLRAVGALMRIEEWGRYGR